MTKKSVLIDDYQMFRIGDWEVSPGACTVSRVTDGHVEEAKITPRSMDVLRLLTERRGNVVSPAEFLETIWRSPIATDHAVHKAIAELRSALQDNAHSPRYIKTIPKRGYTLIASVEPVSPPSAGSLTNTSGAVSSDTLNGNATVTDTKRAETDIPPMLADADLPLPKRLSAWRKLS